MSGPHAEDGYGSELHITFADFDSCPHPAGSRCGCPFDTYLDDAEKGIERRSRYAVHHAPPTTMPPVDDEEDVGAEDGE